MDLLVVGLIFPRSPQPSHGSVLQNGFLFPFIGCWNASLEQNTSFLELSSRTRDVFPAGPSSFTLPEILPRLIIR